MHIQAITIIAHLEGMVNQEQEDLRDLAQLVAESDAADIWDKKLEYHLLQQRISGIQDTIEEVKAYYTGLFVGGEDNENPSERMACSYTSRTS